MTIAGVYNLLYDILGLDVVNAVVDAYVASFGVLSICLEYKRDLFGEDFQEFLKDEFKFIYKPYGRAFLYVLFGLLMFSETGSIVYMIAGPYVTLVGAFIFYIFMQAEKEYAQMKAANKLDDTHLRSEFNKADKGSFLSRDGKLDSKEFGSQVCIIQFISCFHLCVFLLSLHENIKDESANQRYVRTSNHVYNASGFREHEQSKQDVKESTAVWLIDEFELVLKKLLKVFTK